MKTCISKLTEYSHNNLFALSYTAAWIESRTNHSENLCDMKEISHHCNISSISISGTFQHTFFSLVYSITSSFFLLISYISQNAFQQYDNKTKGMNPLQADMRSRSLISPD